MGSKTTTSTQENKPPAWAQPGLESIAGGAQNLFNQGSGFNPFPGGIPELSGLTQQGMGAAQSMINTPASMDLATTPMNAANQVIGTGGQGPGTAGALGTMGDIASGGGNAQTDLFSQLFGQSQQPGAAQQYLQSTAAGDMLHGNPYFNEMVDKQSGKIADQLGSMFSGSGRYGSGAHQGVLGQTLGDFRLGAMAQNYGQERQNQLNAASTMESAQQGRMGLGQGAAQGLAGTQLANTGMQLGAAGQQAGTEQDALRTALGFTQALPGIQQNKMFDANQLLGLGNIEDQRNQQQLMMDMQNFFTGDNADWQRLLAQLQATSGAAGNFGTGIGKVTEPFNWLGAAGTIGSMFI